MNKYLKIGLKIFLALLVLFVLFLPLIDDFGGNPIKGQIIDGVTRKPISDVLVVVTWNRKSLNSLSSGLVVDAKETISDKNGFFDLQAKTGLIGSKNVHLYFYKKGYEFKVIWSFNKGEVAEDIKIPLNKFSKDKSGFHPLSYLSTYTDYRHNPKDREDRHVFLNNIPKTVKVLAEFYNSQ